MAWIWIHGDLAQTIHDEQLAEHGGQPGIRDKGLLESALARPVNKAEYEDADISSLAAAYGYGIARNHPFVDGNKRVAFVLTELFLNLNGFALEAKDTACLEVFLALAEGSLSEDALGEWLRRHITSDADE